MTDEEMIKVMHKTCFGKVEDENGWHFNFPTTSCLLSFARRIAQLQIEKDAEICDRYAKNCTDMDGLYSAEMGQAYKYAADAIRAQGE